MSDLDTIWHKFVSEKGLLQTRPDFRFDPEFYKLEYAQANDQTPEALFEHYQALSSEDGKHPTFFRKLLAQAPGIIDPLKSLIIDQDLLNAMDHDPLHACELAFELVILGEGIDSKISNFSMQRYLDLYPDIVKAKMNPLMHYLRYAVNEGGRETLTNIRRNHYSGNMYYRGHLPTVLITLHDMASNELSSIGQKLVKEASLRHNVIVASLHDGDLLDAFKEYACELVVTEHPLSEFSYFQGHAFDRIEFAIVLSQEAFLFVHLLVATDIPFTAYIDEHAELTTPVYKSTVIALFADQIVFSSDLLRRSWEGRLKDVEFDIQRDTRVIPHRELQPKQLSSYQVSNASNVLSKILDLDLTGTQLVCGAGALDWSKGPDLFAITAQLAAVQKQKIVFIWVGDHSDLNHENQAVLLDYHSRQTNANTQQSNLFFLPAGPHYQDVLAASNIFFLSSRIDSLPTPAFEAVEHGCHIFHFEGASGFSDSTIPNLDCTTSVEYANPAAALDGICKFLTADSCTDNKQRQTSDLAPHNVSQEILSSLSDALGKQTSSVYSQSDFDLPILFTSSVRDRPLRVKEREKILRHGRRFIWHDIDEVNNALLKSTNWVHTACSLLEYTGLNPSTDVIDLPRFSIHIHAYYLDDLAADLRGRVIYGLAHRIVVTTDTAVKAREIQRILQETQVSATVQVVPNKGRDILPFLKLFPSSSRAKDDEIWCHIHQKKSLSSAKDGDMWRRFLMRILLGNTTEISSALSLMSDKNIGLVAPFEPHHIPWSGARRLLSKISDKLHGPLPDNPFLFPVGNMFWVRGSVINAMNDVFGEHYPWPNEPIPNDGTEFHLIERLWPAITAQSGQKALFLHKADEPRV